MQITNLCEPYLRSTEVIRIVQSNNQTFINKILDCIGRSKADICSNIVTRHPLIPADLLQLCRDDAFQQAQLILLKEIQHNRFAATTETCIPFLVRVFRNLYWREYQKEISRKKMLNPVKELPADEAKDTGPDDAAQLQREKIKQLLSQLSKTDREIYRLRYVEGLKVREIAPLLNIEEGSVTKQLLRLHRRFESLWQ